METPEVEMGDDTGTAEESWEGLGDEGEDEGEDVDDEDKEGAGEGNKDEDEDMDEGGNEGEGGEEDLVSDTVS